MADSQFNDLLSLTVTFQSDASTVDALHQEVANWSNVTGLVNLTCACYALPSPRYTSEIRMPEMTYAQSTHQILLNDQYPQILPQYQAVVSDGFRYDVQGLSVDYYLDTTILFCRKLGS